MKQVAIVAGLLSLLSVAGTLPAQSPPAAADSIHLPAGSKLEVALIAPVWARTAKPGDPLYAQVDFPTLSGKSIAIPAGAFVQGQILSVSRPSRFKGHAKIQAVFTAIIFANGYAVQLPSLSGSPAFLPASLDPPSAPAALSSPKPTVMELAIDVTAGNDLLLDNGSQFDVILASPLSLEIHQLSAAIAASRAVDLGSFKSATLCRPTLGTPGTPGTPGTVIPGSPGTPSTTVPGGPGMPDIVIPGTPATPDTVIPGSPGTPGFPGVSCPSAPFVVSSTPLAAASASAASTVPNHP